MLPTLFRNLLAHIKRCALAQCRCALCFNTCNESGFLCDSCYEELPRTPNACVQCAQALPTTGRCGQCQQQPPSYDYSHCSYLYQAPFTHWLPAVKDRHKLQWLKRLAYLMQQYPPTTLTYIDAFACIPSHKRQLLRRGFNPAALLAEHLAHHFKKPLLTDALRKRPNQDQRGLTRKQRLRNVRHAFYAGGQNVQGKHILLIDDVMTSGATVDAAAKTLKQQGALSVSVWALARAIAPNNTQ